MKKNFTKFFAASVVMAGLGLAYAANEAQEIDPSAINNISVEWGLDNDELPNDMINVGVPFRVSGVDFIDPSLVPYVTISAELYEFQASVSDDDIDPGFSVAAPVRLDSAAFHVNDEGGIFTVNFFPEVLEGGKTYGIMLKNLQVYVETFQMMALDIDLSTNELANIQFEVLEPIAFDAALVNGGELVSLSSHSAVSAEKAEGVRVQFLNAFYPQYATYTVDQVVDEESAISLASGNLQIKGLGYGAFEKPLTLISGYQYKVTVKAWNETEAEVLASVLDGMIEPALVEVYTVNGASATGLVGEVTFGVERGEFPEDMINLGIPVRLPELQLPFGVDAEDCEITVSATLFGIPEGNIPMPLAADDEDIDPGMGVDGPVELATCLVQANIVGGVPTAYVFAENENLEVGNHYAVQINAVTVVDAENNIVAELGEDDYFATDFIVTPYVAPIELGQAEWVGLDENGMIDVEEAAISGLKLTFPFANLGTEDATISVYAVLYDVTNQGEVVGNLDDELDGGFGVVGPVAVADGLFEGVMNIESGVYEVSMFADKLEADKNYVIDVMTITATNGEETILQWDNEEEQLYVEFSVYTTALSIEPAFICGDDQIALNGHSQAIVETASALAVNFVNGLDLKAATYAIDRVDGEELVAVASGALSLNRVGYAAFEQPLTFVAGCKYVLTIKAWNVAETLDENLAPVEPVAVAQFEFNGAANGTIGVVEFGIERGEFSSDMINIGVPVRMPELLLPFGLAAEDCQINVSATLYGIPEGNTPMPLAVDDDIDGGFGVDGPVALSECKVIANVEGGVPTAYLFAEDANLEVGNHYAIIVNAITVVDSENEIVAELGEDEYVAVDFFVVKGENDDPTAINGIAAENGKVVMINVLGQKANKGIVIVNGVKALVK